MKKVSVSLAQLFLLLKFFQIVYIKKDCILGCLPKVWTTFRINIYHCGENMFHLYMKFQHSLDWVIIKKHLSDFLHRAAFAASILENKNCIAHFAANNSVILRKSPR